MTPTVSRRQFLAGTSSAVLLSTLGGVRVGRAQARQIVITDPGGEWQTAAARALYGPFEKETGVKVAYAARPHMSMGKLKAMVGANNQEWDVTVLVKQLVPLAVKQGLLEPIDWNRIDRNALLPGAVHPHFVGNHISASLIAYAPKRVSPEPRNWADFWDAKKIPGRRSMFKGTYHTLEIALLADGVPGDKLYPLDIDRAFRSLDRVKPHVQIWWPSGAQSVQLMLDNEVDLLYGWNGRVTVGIEKGAPFKMVWNQAVAAFEGWCVPKGTKNLELAQQFVAFTARAERQAEYARNIAYGPSNTGAYKFLPAERATVLPTYPENYSRMVQEDPEWISANQVKIEERLQQWFAAS